MADELERESFETLFRDYVGQSLWHINTIQHLMTTMPNEMPQYVEIAHPEKVDNSTADDIKAHLLKELGWKDGNVREP